MTLLDSVLAQDPNTLVEGSSAHMNSQALMSFLGILTKIEQVSASHEQPDQDSYAELHEGLVNDHHST